MSGGVDDRAAAEARQWINNGLAVGRPRDDAQQGFIEGFHIGRLDGKYELASELARLREENERLRHQVEGANLGLIESDAVEKAEIALLKMMEERDALRAKYEGEGARECWAVVDSYHTLVPCADEDNARLAVDDWKKANPEAEWVIMIRYFEVRE